MDLHDVDPALLVGVWELDLPVDSTGPEQGGVEDVNSVGGHDDLDVGGRLESVELVEELEHGSLDLGVSTCGEQRQVRSAK